MSVIQPGVIKTKSGEAIKIRCAEIGDARDLIEYMMVGKTKIALQNSLYSIIVEENGSAIGMGRIVGDGGIYYYIQDVIVIPERQNRGIGTKIMEYLMSHIKKVAEPGSFIALMSAEGRTSFYKRFGFAERENDAPGMFFIMK